MPQIFEMSAQLCNYYGIYMFKVHVHCIVYHSLLWHVLYILVNKKNMNYYIT